VKKDTKKEDVKRTDSNSTKLLPTTSTFGETGGKAATSEKRAVVMFKVVVVNVN
jgi:hypothetical protein